MTEAKIDLAAEGLLAAETPTTPANEPPVDADELIEYIQQALTSLTTSMAGLTNSVGALQVGIRVQNTRIEQLEKYVSYLLGEDPKMADKVKAMAAQHAAEKAAAAPEAPKATP